MSDRREHLGVARMRNAIRLIASKHEEIAARLEASPLPEQQSIGRAIRGHAESIRAIADAGAEMALSGTLDDYTAAFDAQLAVAGDRIEAARLDTWSIRSGASQWR